MADKSKRGTFTGKHMALVFVGGFGVVIAVNLMMASLAVGTFHGTVVDNSYAASQNYNGWLDKAAQSRALGWQAKPQRRADGRVVLETVAVPSAATITAFAERPLGERESAELTFTPQGEGGWLSDKSLAPGRWNLRIAIRAEGREWAGEGELQ